MLKILSTACDNFFHSKDPTFIFFRRIAYLTVFTAAILVIASDLAKMGSLRFLLSKDLAQDYVMGKALAHGLNPYQPISDLLQIYFPSSQFCNDLNLSPHTPLMVIIFSYLSFFDFQALSISIYVFSLVALFISVSLISKKDLHYSILIFCLFLLSCPTLHDLVQGQFNCILILLCAFYYTSRLKNRDFVAGILLGLCLQLKVFGIVLVFYSILYKEWKVIAGAALTSILAIPILLLHFDLKILFDYAEVVLPSVFREWINNPGITSVFSIPYKFEHSFTFHSAPGNCFVTRVLPEYSSLTRMAGIALTTLILTFAFKRILKKGNFSQRFSSVLALSAIINPISWIHYAVSLLPKFIENANEIYNRKGKSSRLVIILILLVCYFDFSLYIYSTYPKIGLNESFSISPVYMLLSMIPTLLIFLIAIL